MKRFILFFFVTAFSPAFADLGAMIGIDDTFTTSYARLNVFTSKDLIGYSLGGTLYVYPPEIVNPLADPRIYVTVQLNDNSSLTDAYTAVVSGISALNATITVWKISAGGIVVEANSGEVDLNILVIQDVIPYPA